MARRTILTLNNVSYLVPEEAKPEAVEAEAPL